MRWLPATVLLLQAGCPRPRCDAQAPSRVELRDGAGALLLAARGGGADLELCNGGGLRVGTVQLGPSTARLRDPAGQTRLHLRRESPGDASADGPRGPRL